MWPIGRSQMVYYLVCTKGKNNITELNTDMRTGLLCTRQVSCYGNSLLTKAMCFDCAVSIQIHIVFGCCADFLIHHHMC